MHAVCASDLGSPPLTRGKELDAGDAAQKKRITPAYAGKSLVEAMKAGNLKDHPRLRGEKKARHSPIRTLQGSPPLTRGKVPVAIFAAGAAGITPAYAGKRFRFV